MARTAFSSLQSNIIPPPIPTAPQILGIGVVPSDHGLESHSAPCVLGDVVIVQTFYWKRIHFCNVNCGAPCKVTWSYKRGISQADANEISSKIGGQVPGTGVSAAIGSKISSTITLSSEEQATREFTRTAPGDGGVTHAHWQLMERYIFTWTVKRWFRDPKTEIHMVEGSTDVFDETLLFYMRPDCAGSKEQESFLDKLKKGLQPFIAQGSKAGVLLPGKSDREGSFSFEGFIEKYKPGDRIPGNLVTRRLRLSPRESRLLKESEPFYLQPYTSPLDSYIGKTRQEQLTWQNNRLLAWSVGAGIGMILGVLFAPRSGEETREAIRSRAQDGGEYLKNRSREARETVSQWVDRGKDVVSQQKEQISAAIDATRQAYRETSEGKKGS